MTFIEYISPLDVHKALIHPLLPFNETGLIMPGTRRKFE
jgi:hypothetical protein